MNFPKFTAIFKTTSVQILLLILLTVISYGNILQNGFAWDDSDFFEYWFTIQDGKTVSSIFSLPDLLAGELPEGHRGVYRPVRSVYYLISYQLYGNEPVFYHLQSILVHALIVILVYLIIDLILRNKLASFIGGAIFATHPIHTEAVSYTTASMDTVGILFFFASFYFYLRARTIKDQVRLTIFLSVILAVLAFFTYEMTLILPLLLIMYELTFSKFKWQKLKSYFIFTPFFASLGFYAIIRFYLLQIGNRADYLGHVFIVASNQSKIAAPEFYLQYLKLLLFPVGLTVTHHLPTNLLNSFFKLMFYLDPEGNLLNSITPAATLFPILFILLVIIVSYLLFKKHKAIFFGISWFFLSFLTVSNIIPQGASFAERYLYIGSFSLSLIAGYLSIKLQNLKLPPHLRPAVLYLASFLFILLISFYTYSTIKRNADWKNEETIMVHAVKSNPNSFVANGALGIVKLNNGKYDEAISLFNKALQTDPFAFNTKLHLGTTYQKKGDYDKAIKEFNEAIGLSPGNFTGYMFLAGAYAEKGDYQAAIDAYDKTILLKNDDSLIHFNQGLAYMKFQKYDQALSSYSKALEIRPDYPSALMNAGYIYRQQNKLEQAALFYEKSLDSNPDSVKVHLALGEIYTLLGDKARARLNYELALKAEPQNTLVKSKLQKLEAN